MEDSFIHFWRSHIERLIFTILEEPQVLLLCDLLVVGLLFTVVGAVCYRLGFRHGSKSSRQVNAILDPRVSSVKIETAPRSTPQELPASHQSETPVPAPAESKQPSAALPKTVEEKAQKPKAPWSYALKKSREPLLARLQDAWGSLTGSESWSDTHPLWDSLEEALITSDIGPQMTDSLLESLKKEFREKPTEAHLRQQLRARMLEVFSTAPGEEFPDTPGPHVTLLIGVNGSGKTTTAGKLAFQFKEKGKTVVLGAGDTFRAAAVEQLQTWADRIGVECIKPAKGANPAAVAFDAVAAGLSRNADEIIIDTAGRLHTKESLMDELEKVGRVIAKKIPGAPHRVLLVLDATLGQNALIQAKEFSSAIKATGVVLTKLDGSSKGGAALSVVAELGLPVVLVGVGEAAEDLRPFLASEFVANLIPDA